MIPASTSKAAGERVNGAEEKSSHVGAVESLKSWLFPIAFGNQTISRREALELNTFAETHGFASPPRGGFAFIVCNRLIKIIVAGRPATLLVNDVSALFVNS